MTSNVLFPQWEYIWLQRPRDQDVLQCSTPQYLHQHDLLRQDNSPEVRWRSGIHVYNRKKLGQGSWVLGILCLRPLFFGWDSYFFRKVFTFTLWASSFFLKQALWTSLLKLYSEIPLGQKKLSPLMTKPTKWSMHPAKTQISLIRLCECQGWSESLLVAYVILLVCREAAQMLLWLF